jgi:hypothetical protein
MLGRPSAEIDPEKVENAAALGATIDEIATILGVGRRTLYDRLDADPELKESLDRGRAKGRATLRRLQWQQAHKGNVTMQIWLGKQLLGQTDKQEHSGADGGPIQHAVRHDLSKLTDAELEQLHALSAKVGPV